MIELLYDRWISEEVPQANIFKQKRRDFYRTYPSLFNYHDNIYDQYNSFNYVKRTKKPNVKVIKSINYLSDKPWLYPVIMAPKSRVNNNFPSIVSNNTIHNFLNKFNKDILTNILEGTGWLYLDLSFEVLPDYFISSFIKKFNELYPDLFKKSIIVKRPTFFELKFDNIFIFSNHVEDSYYIHIDDFKDHLPGGEFNTKKSNLLLKTGVVNQRKRYCYFNYQIDHYNPIYDYRRKSLKFLDENNLISKGHVSSGDHTLKNTYKFLSINALKLSDFNLVIESYFDSKDYFYTTPLVTEKTYRNFLYKKPFILLSQYHSLKLVKKLGYKTFSPFIDESYDDIEDNDLRFKTAMNEAMRLINLNDDKFKELMSNINSVLDFNYAHLFKRRDESLNILFKHINFPN